MKGFLACVLAAVDDFLAAPLRMPLHLAFSYDEEVGCLGVRSLVDFLQASPEKPALCLIGEPTEMQPVFGHKGKLAMRCCIEGAGLPFGLCPAGGERHPLRGQADQPFGSAGRASGPAAGQPLFAALQHAAGGHHSGWGRAEYCSAVLPL